MYKVDDMVIVKNCFNTFIIFQIKKITKQFIFVGKYNDNSELYRFKKVKTKNEFIGVGSLDHDYNFYLSYLYLSNNEEIVKKHLEKTLNFLNESMIESINIELEKKMNFNLYYKIMEVLSNEVK